MKNDGFVASDHVQIAVRVSPELYAKILRRKMRAEKESALKPTVSAIVRLMLEECPEKKR